MHSTDLTRAQSRATHGTTTDPTAGAATGMTTCVAAAETADWWSPCGWWPDTARDLGPDAHRPGATATFVLPPRPESIHSARTLAAGTLGDWHLVHLTEGMGMVVSELTTNALRHGLTLTGPRTAEPLRMSLIRRGALVTCAVVDLGPHPPVLRVPAPLEPGGLGLHIVESISLRWGWSPLVPHGKAVWAILQG